MILLIIKIWCLIALLAPFAYKMLLDKGNLQAIVISLAAKHLSFTIAKMTGGVYVLVVLLLAVIYVLVCPILMYLFLVQFIKSKLR